MDIPDDDAPPLLPDDRLPDYQVPHDPPAGETVANAARQDFFAIPLWLQAIASHLYTHNPFYLISSGLVLFGLQTSFSENHELANGWLLMQLLCGYALLLAAVGCLIVRWGNVWEDARMVLLVILLLFVALSNSFDRFVLDDYVSGGQMLAVGFFFSVVLTEALFFFLPMRLAARYRVPLYLQLALLFAYPVWLAYLSIQDMQPQMAWYVYLFPVFGAVTVLALLPAAHGGGKNEPASGTPWRWPWFPWSVFAFLALGMMLRSYSLSLSFEIAGGMEAAFQPYFLLPLLLACILVWVEGCLATGHRTAANWLLLTPLLLIPLSLPGPVENAAQLFVTLMLNDSVGAPARLYLLVLAVVYAIAWWRKMPIGEPVTLLMLGLLSIVGPGTRAIGSLQYPIWEPLAVAVLLELAAGLWQRNSMRIVVSSCCLVLGTLMVDYNIRHLPGMEVYALFVVLLIVLLVGLVCTDRFARWLRHQLPYVLTFGSWAIAILGTLRVPLAAECAMLGSLVVLAFIAWRMRRNVAQLMAFAASVCSTSALLAEPANRLMRETILAKGMYWLLAGLLALIAGFLISLQKGGLLSRLRHWLSALNQSLAGW